jgi:hypothetical protein
VRDARPQGAQERRPRQDRILAGRSDLTAFAAARFAFAILFDALAFVVWDVGTRPPQRLAGDLVAGLRSPRRLLTGLLRFGIGAGLLVLAIVVALPAIPSLRAFTVLETGMLIAALLVEALIGEDLRRALRRGDAHPSR